MVMKRTFPFHMRNTIVRPNYHSIAMLVGVPLVVTLTMVPFAFSEDTQVHSEESVAEQAKVVWRVER